MTFRTLTIAAGLALSSAMPALAQGYPSREPQSDATVLGSQGPASNSVGYPSARRQAGTLNAVRVAPAPTARSVARNATPTTVR